MRVMVLGGAGYIGSHTCVALAEAGHSFVVVDSHVNSAPAALNRVAQIVGRPVEAYEFDIRETDRLEGVLRSTGATAVIHFAALKSVARSVAEPLSYYDNNVGGTISVLQAMRQARVVDLVFSSSATVYGANLSVPVREDAPLAPCNPYGRSKHFMEELVTDVCAADPMFGAMLLRYFNPVGAHPSGLIGEDPRGVPDNLMPYLAQVAVGRRERLQIFGGDWPTTDGTGIRDYVHVMDLARAHVAALDALSAGRRGATAINLGTGHGTSVLELVQAFSRACGREIPYEIVGRRDGDVAESWAAPGLARDLLGWSAEHDIDAMCRDTWNWQSANPHGYG